MGALTAPRYGFGRRLGKAMGEAQADGNHGAKVTEHVIRLSTAPSSSCELS